MAEPEPPRIAEWLTRFMTASSAYADAILGDMKEEHARSAVSSPRVANRQYWRSALSVSLHFVPSRLRHAFKSQRRAHDIPPDSGTTMALNDLRFAARTLRRAPGFALAAIVALGLGTGATAAVFSLLQGVVLRPLPYEHPEQLVMLWDTDNKKGLPHQPISPVTFRDYRALSTSFADAAAWWRPQVNLIDKLGEPVRVNAVEATDNLFPLLGVKPHLGSDFVHHPDLYGPEHQTIISHRFWQSRYGGDASVIGKQVSLNGSDYTIVGVMNEGFGFPGETDMWLQLQWDLARHSRSAHFMESVARMRPGVTLEQINRELSTLSSRLATEFKTSNDNWSAGAVSLEREISGVFRPALFALFGASTLLLFIACINVANLLLARAVSRRREVAVRSALGARRARLVRLFLTESLVLAGIGSALGLLVAYASVKGLLAWSPIQIPRADMVHVDLGVLTFVTAIAALTAVGFGLVPALFMSRADLQSSLKEGTRGAGSQSRRLRSVLVVAEVALSVMLLAGSGLLIRSVSNLLNTDAGLDPSQTISVDIQLPNDYSWKRAEQFYTSIVQATRANPAVISAGVTNFLPLNPGWRLPYQLAAAPLPEAPQAQVHTADEGYFETLHIPLLGGRLFTPRDDSASIPVVLVNEAMARQIAAGSETVSGGALNGKAISSSVIGKRLSFNLRNIGPLSRRQSDGNEHEIVGVVGDVRNNTMRNAAEPAIYFSVPQFPSRPMFLVIRGRGDIAQLAEIARSEVRRLDAALAVGDIKPMERTLAASADPPRFVMLLMTVFAGFALALAAVGIYGVLTFMVSNRRREIGIRMALGAQPGEMLRMIIREGVVMALIGSLIGVLGTFIAARALGGFLYGIAPWDPATLAGVVGVVMLVAATACLIPGRRAAAEDPANALRVD